MEYRIAYRHGENQMQHGVFDSEEEAMAWWNDMTNQKRPDGVGKPRDWVLQRRETRGISGVWVDVASHDAGLAED